MALQHLRASTADKRPTPAAMADGQLAMNTNLAGPGLFFKDSNGDLVKVGPVHVGTTAPNATPAAGGQAGNSKGEQWLDTSGTNPVFKIWDGSNWASEAGEFVNASGDTMTGALVMDNQQQVRFREASGNGTNFIALQAPTSVSSDKTITLPDVTGTVVTTGDTGTVTSTMLLDGTIVNADVNASAAIVDTKLATIATAGKVSNSATTATNANTASAIVARDASGNFSAGTVTASLTGAASLNVLKAGDTMTGVLAVTAGTAALPAITPSGDPNTGIYSPGADQLAISTNAVERVEFGAGEVVFNDGGENYDFRIEGDTNANLFFVDASTDRVGLGTSSPAQLLETQDGNIQIRNSAGLSLNTLSTYGLTFRNTNQVGQDRGTIAEIKTYLAGVGDNDFGLQFRTQATTAGGVTTKMTLTPGGSLGIGTTAPSSNGSLTVIMPGSANEAGVVVRAVNAGGVGSQSALVFEKPDGTKNSQIVSDIGTGYLLLDHIGSGSIVFKSNSAERAQIDSSGRLLVGTSSTSGSAAAIQIVQGLAGINNSGCLLLARNDATPADGNDIGQLVFGDSGHTRAAEIRALRDGGTWTSGSSQPSRLVFSVTADGAASPTEALRISNDRSITVSDGGNVILGTTTGTKIGTGTTQKLGFYNATPVVQPTAVADATDAATAISQLNALLAHMRTLGLIAT
jgi:hypothetical protein